MRPNAMAPPAARTPGMPGKAKTQKHSAKELAAKAAAATQNKGGGKAGLADRKGGSVGHSRYKCPVCMANAPDLKTMGVSARRPAPARLTCLPA